MASASDARAISGRWSAGSEVRGDSRKLQGHRAHLNDGGDKVGGAKGNGRKRRGRSGEVPVGYAVGAVGRRRAFEVLKL